MSYAMSHQKCCLGTLEDNIAQGDIAGMSLFRLLGYNACCSSSEELIWTESVVLSSYTWLSAASTIKISSTSNNDTLAGTGARKVRITGLNSSYAEITEVVNMNGQTSVNTANQYIRINELIVTEVGSLTYNAGIVYAGTGTVSAGVNSIPIRTINTNDSVSFCSIFTVPAGKTLYIKNINIVGIRDSQAVEVKLYKRGTDAASPRIMLLREQVRYNFIADIQSILKITEKTDIFMTTAQITGSNCVNTSSHIYGYIDTN